MGKTVAWSEEVRDTGSERQGWFVMRYRPVITQIACQIASGLPPAVDLNDLISDGTIGLIKAIGSFDASRQVQFSSYAEGRIRGAILDGLRSLDWMPRSLRRSLKRVERAKLDIQQQHGRAATSEELAGEMELSLEALHGLMSTAAPGTPSAGPNGQLRPYSVPPVSPDDISDPSGLDPHSELMRKEIRSTLTEAVKRLPHKEHVVISLYYFGDMNLKEIGRYLGLSESRVCQIHARAMARVRKIVLRLNSISAAPRCRIDANRLLEAS